jgi:hypothetical protein
MKLITVWKTFCHEQSNKVKNKKTRQIAMVARDATIGQFAEENLIHRGC